LIGDGSERIQFEFFPGVSSGFLDGASANQISDVACAPNFEVLSIKFNLGRFLLPPPGADMMDASQLSSSPKTS
jgi:hypothetical protein